MTHRDRAGDPPGRRGAADDAGHRQGFPTHPPPGPTDRPRDLYGSLSTRLGIRQWLILSVAAEQFAVFLLGEAVGHAGDVVGDQPGPRRVARNRRAGPPRLGQ